jgi:3-hydroxyacyl-CoA dehydrogenase/enoyl-CoA hydratase/carnithine racemase
VAAVHGAALGGGLEVALACHYIVASDDPATQLGLPEVMLGLLPAAGGTQRLVARVGLTAALPLLLTGKKLRARQALKLGLVDAVTTPGGIAETAAKAALALAEGTLSRKEPSGRRRLEDALARLGPARSLVLRKAREGVQRKTRGLYPAPLAILDCVERGLARGEAAGLACEAELFGDLVVSPESRSLVWLFEAMTERKKAPKAAGGDGPRRVEHLGVLGAGFMGAGIAAASLNICPVTVRDVSGESLARGAKVIRGGLAAQVKSRAIRQVEMDRLWSRAQLTTRTEDLRGCGLVIEAVFEDLDLKRKVLAEVEAVVSEGAVVASNTSALPISRIAAEAAVPERVLGMHYFSPVHKMPLLELVVTDATASWAVATARAFASKQGKSTIVVKDGPGFYTTRILAPYLNEAMVALEEGAAIEAVDRALKDFGYPVGPIALIDEVGIDVGAHVARDLGAAFADRGGTPSGLLPKLVEAGLKGRKGGKGFYLYPAAGKKARKQPNAAVYALLDGAERREASPRLLQDRLSLVMVNEAVHCLAEGVVASPGDGDVGAILGLGFPPFRGGPFHHVDALGVDAVVRRLEELAQSVGPRFTPAPLLVEMARSGQRFYP